MDPKIIGKKLRDYRLKNHLSQKELAARLFVSNKTVSRWELGNGLPDIAELPHIAELIGMSIDELVGDPATVDKLERSCDGKELPDDEALSVAKRISVKRRLLIALLCAVGAVAAISATLIPIMLHLNAIGVFSTRTSTYIFEAEDAEFTDSFRIEQVEHASGGAVAAWLHNSGEKITFRITSDRDAEVRLGLVFTRAAPFVFEDRMRLEINDVQKTVGNIVGIGDGDYSPYYAFGDPVYVDVKLDSGVNRIVFVMINGIGTNIDCIRLETSARLTLNNKPYAFEAERAEIDGLYSELKSDSASGGKYIKWADVPVDQPQPHRSITFRIFSEESAWLKMSVSIAHPYDMEFEMKYNLYVNGEQVTVGGKKGVKSADSETAFADPFVVGINMISGENVITFECVNPMNFDCIAFYTSLTLA